MNESTANVARIVAGVDGSESALQAVRWGAIEAARRSLPLMLVHALGIPRLYVGAWPPSNKLRAKLIERGESLLAAAKKVAQHAAQAEISSNIDNENPPEALVAASRSASMIVLGAPDHGDLTGLAFGSTALQTTTHAHCPVVVVRGEDVGARPDNDPIVVGVDNSPLSDATLGCAFEEAALRSAPLIAVHTWWDNEAAHDVIDEARFSLLEPVADIEQQALIERIDRWRNKYPDVPIKLAVEWDKPRRKLLELSVRAQLVVVGSRGRGGMRGLLLGSTSQALIHHASCPVMVVRQGPSVR